MKNLLKLMDLSEKEIVEILNTADQLKFEKKNGIPHRLLEGKTLGLHAHARFLRSGHVRPRRYVPLPQFP